MPGRCSDDAHNSGRVRASGSWVGVRTLPWRRCSENEALVGSCRGEGLEPAVGFDSPVVSAGLWRTFHVRGEHEVYRGAKQGAERYNTCVLGYTA